MCEFDLSALKPMPVLLKPVVLLASAELPSAVFELPPFPTSERTFPGKHWRSR